MKSIFNKISQIPVTEGKGLKTLNGSLAKLRVSDFLDERDDVRVGLNIRPSQHVF